MAAPRLCSIPDCGKRHEARGLCVKHYRQKERTGTPIPIPSSNRRTAYAKRYFLDVVLSYEGEDCLTWPYKRTSDGYGSLSWEGRNRIVSRLVCEKEHGPPPSPKHQAAHSCGKGTSGCVAKRHLSWKTALGNKTAELLHGTRSRGERQGSSKLTEADVRTIRTLEGTASLRDIGERYGVLATTIWSIYRGLTWSWLQ